jgi:hypothetical protein
MGETADKAENAGDADTPPIETRRSSQRAAFHRQYPNTRILMGLNALRRDNPWPEFIYGEIEPFFLPLDGGRRAGQEVGGGRELILRIIRERKIELMVEIGCFLCGSTLQWLHASDKLTVIGVDPWDNNWAGKIERLAHDPLQARTVFHLTESQIATIIANLRRHGNFAIAMNNVRLYKSRFIPIRALGTDALLDLKDRGIEPQMIYIDADKESDDLSIAHQLFPEAILCGDDWLWPDKNGVLVMQEHVKAFAERHNFEIEHDVQSWALTPRKG